MNKYAAEKVAEEYYTLGLQLAFEKVAGILDKATAAMLAKNFAKDIGQAGKLTSEAGALRRFSGHIPGTKMHKAQKVLRGATGNANMDIAKNVHNLGFDQQYSSVAGKMRQAGPREMVTGKKQPVNTPPFTNADTRFRKNYNEGNISNFYRPSEISPLSEQLGTMPSERHLLDEMRLNKDWRRMNPNKYKNDLKRHVKGRNQARLDEIYEMYGLDMLGKAPR